MHILQSMYSFYYLPPSCFGVVAIFRELMPNCHYNIETRQFTIDTFVVMLIVQILVIIIVCVRYKIMLLIQ